MYRPRILFLIISLVVLILASLSYRLVSSSARYEPRRLFDSYTPPDRITLLRGADTVLLVKTSRGWEVNDYPADADRVAVLLAALEQCVMRRPVSRSETDSINHLIDTGGVRVQVFAGSRMLLAFSVAGNDTRTRTYIRKADDRQPHEAVIPGYRVFVAAIFELKPADWLDKRLFNFNWQNFIALNASFPGAEEDDFTVSMQRGNFQVDGLPTDTARLHDYLDGISLLEADGFLTDLPASDTSLQISPRVIIQVRTVSGQTYQLRLYHDQSAGMYRAITAHLPVALLSEKKAETLLRRKKWFARVE
jgi:hypothetical protein